MLHTNRHHIFNSKPCTGISLKFWWHLRWWRTYPYIHDDVIKWKHFPRYWPFLRGIHRSPVYSLHKGQWHGALMFSLICTWIIGKQWWGWWFDITVNIYIYIIFVGHYKELSTQRPGSPKNTTQQHDVSVQSTLDRRPIYYSQKMDPSSPNANSIMWTHTSLEINIKFKIK